jgi:N-acetylglucosamine kinase-like BadF-type ATPase
MEALYFGRMGHERVAELSPVVFEAAAEGDMVARSIVDRQADEVVTMAGTAIRRLRMTELEFDVVLGGGIFRNRFEPFFLHIRNGIAQVAPHARVVVLAAPPVAGAALLGLDRLAAPRAAAKRIRTALTYERLTAETARTKEGVARWRGSSSTA